MQYAKHLQFEEAQKAKNTLDALQSLTVNQIVRDSISGNYNIIHGLEKYDSYFIGIIHLRDGKIVDLKNYEIHTQLDETLNEVMEAFVEQQLAEETDKNIKYILPTPLSSENPLLQKLDIEVPKI